ncbi:hypothetical protein, partial [Leyella stercorea]|uniref:hypothetical protein n=1 Tax=Leyella stercorea TaxID=363265 RepID=UPI0040294E0C
GRISYARNFCEFCEIRGRKSSAISVREFGEICGRISYARNFCEFCEIRGRISSARNFCEFGEFCGRKSSARSFREFGEFCGRTSEGGVGMAGCHTLLQEKSVGEYPQQ